MHLAWWMSTISSRMYWRRAWARRWQYTKWDCRHTELPWWPASMSAAERWWTRCAVETRHCRFGSPEAWNNPLGLRATYTWFTDFCLLLTRLLFFWLTTQHKTKKRFKLSNWHCQMQSDAVHNQPTLSVLFCTTLHDNELKRQKSGKSDTERYRLDHQNRVGAIITLHSYLHNRRKPTSSE